ncbi:hypothetical protein FS749_006199, partial [Ceratobasidium sp. UAMH 11750]
GHADLVSTVTYSPNGAYILSGSSDKTIHIWDSQPKGLLEPPTEIPSADPVPPSRSEALLYLLVQWVPFILDIFTGRIAEYNLSQGHGTLNRQGWVVNANKDRIIWVPHDVRDILLQPRKTAVVPRPNSSVRLDFMNSKLGVRWTQYSGSKYVSDVN